MIVLLWGVFSEGSEWRHQRHEHSVLRVGRDTEHQARPYFRDHAQIDEAEDRALGAGLRQQARQAFSFAAIERATMFWLPVAHWIVKVIPAIRQPSAVRVSW